MLDDFFLQIDFDIALIHVDDNIEFGMWTVFFADHHSEDIFHDPHEDIFIDPFFTNHLGK